MTDSPFQLADEAEAELDDIVGSLYDLPDRIQYTQALAMVGICRALGEIQKDLAWIAGDRPINQEQTK